MANYRFENAQSDAQGKDEPAATLTQRIYDTLLEEIVSGDLRPGDRLVRRTLSQRLGVSPMPVTEALLRLEVDGLVESRPLYGCRVPPLTAERLQNDEVLREAIECQAARLCAANASEEDLAKLLAKAKMVDRMVSQGNPNSKIGMQAHFEFHHDVAEFSGFAGLAEELRRLWFRRLMRLNWLKAVQFKRPPKDWHQQLLAALETRDSELAERKMREHVQFGTEDDRQALEELLQDKSS